jgi:hypothetical protein
MDMHALIRNLDEYLVDLGAGYPIRVLEWWEPPNRLVKCALFRCEADRAILTIPYMEWKMRSGEMQRINYVIECALDAAHKVWVAAHGCTP